MPRTKKGAPTTRKRKKRPDKTRHWCFTINNPTNGDVPNLDEITYMIIGRETSKDGTPHLQGYVVFTTRLRFSQAKKIMPRAHLEMKMGTSKQAADYCKKDGDFAEYGKMPSTGLITKTVNLKKWSIAIEQAKTGNLDDISPDYLVRYYHAFKRMEQECPVKPPPLKEKCNEWILAPSGYGKSTYARGKYPDYYDKAPNKWFIGFREECTLLLDDYGPKELQYLTWYVKRWADNFAFPMETKGGGRNARPTYVVITSQYTIEECFEDPLVVAAIKNRFHVTHLTRWQDRV